MNFSVDEVDLFRELFSTAKTERKHACVLKVQTLIPSCLAPILRQSSLSLLAEGQGYKLWIPLKIEIDECGEMIPNLGAPEVIDINGNERSWRVKLPENVTLTDGTNHSLGDILSLSSTRITLYMKDTSTFQQNFHGKVLHLNLPDKKPVELQLEPVRADRHFFAARFQCLHRTDRM
ncbi:PilZ domain-containing protein [Shewanella sp. D64]|uniref:PilZ domain-containing protein n=1 Tax=unclassified Shewanella TaxID=196818 RepID=UPI0022BA4550|nr:MULTISPECIES: PilZ domain-containing protein [unclassified Shewanella]MEC4727002.1 PilZ domain-containing protein [Shewanella sp. D64]MEC4737741.1 PilZ domain-containing protein [Shewanella sp. E94]WBJ93995.1 PilZ domain-containing protein [Shewanella sp. MTB7]